MCDKRVGTFDSRTYNIQTLCCVGTQFSVGCPGRIDCTDSANELNEAGIPNPTGLMSSINIVVPLDLRRVSDAAPPLPQTGANYQTVSL
jgi:hypothetical protein